MRRTTSLIAMLIVLSACNDGAGNAAAPVTPPNGTNPSGAKTSTKPATSATQHQEPESGDGSPATPLGNSTAAQSGKTNPSPAVGPASPANPANAGGALTPKEKRRIVIKGSRNDDVPGYVWLPARAAGQRFPAILAMYGIKGNKDDGNINRAADILNADGFAVITIDWPGTGERGNIGNTARITDTDVLNWTVGDYGAALNYLQTLPEVDAQRFGYVGASMGAMTGLAFAARDPRVKAIVAIVPIPNPLWGEDDPSSRIAQLGARPSLCVSTSDNSDFSGAVCGNAVAPGVAKTLPGGHELEGFQDQVVNEAKAFFERTLK